MAFGVHRMTSLGNCPTGGTLPLIRANTLTRPSKGRSYPITPSEKWRVDGVIDISCEGEHPGMYPEQPEQPPQHLKELFRNACQFFVDQKLVGDSKVQLYLSPTKGANTPYQLWVYVMVDFQYYVVSITGHVWRVDKYKFIPYESEVHLARNLTSGQPLFLPR